jgi:hypothetical protein
VIFRDSEIGKIKEFPFFEKYADTQSGGNTTQKTTGKSYKQRGGAEGGAVKKKLRIKEY